MKANILLIDDEPIIMDFVSDILSEDGHNIDTASNGRDGLKMACEKEYDLIICDIDLPKMNGVELCRKLLEEKPHIKQSIIFITGKASAETGIFMKENGIKHLLRKPFSIHELLGTVRKMISPNNLPPSA
jgi:DNA-binding response OmpR family regulator